LDYQLLVRRIVDFGIKIDLSALNRCWYALMATSLWSRVPFNVQTAVGRPCTTSHSRLRGTDDGLANAVGEVANIFIAAVLTLLTSHVLWWYLHSMCKNNSHWVSGERSHISQRLFLRSTETIFFFNRMIKVKLWLHLYVKQLLIPRTMPSVTQNAFILVRVLLIG
jgi:hypothetical protein